MILFDIDGTILDMRYLIHFVLRSYDRKHKTDYFNNLKLSEIDVHEDDILPLFRRLQVPKHAEDSVLKWYMLNRWSPVFLLEAHRPFRGVLEVIRWFLIQPNTHVGLNTARPEPLRLDTLRSLNQLGKEFRIEFDSKFLHMNPGGWGDHVLQSKVKGIRHFQDEGYRVLAFVDNEPKNLKAVADSGLADDILLLHADTIFQTSQNEIPPETVRGKEYDLTHLIQEKDLPKHIHFVWHGVNDQANLKQCLASNIFWAEMDVRRDSATGELFLRHDSFRDFPSQEGEEVFYLKKCLQQIKAGGKGAKLDLKENGMTLDQVFQAVDELGFDGTQLWFNGNLELLQESGFRKIARSYPGSVIQCPINFLAPLILGAPPRAREILDMLKGWGVNRFSLDFMIPNKGLLLERMSQWGCEINLYNVFDLESFLQAVLFLPRSITSDFNFPQWGYFGKGSGQNSFPFKLLHSRANS